MSNIQELLKLISENPELTVVPMVDSDIVGEDYGRWLGSFGSCCIGEYALYGERFYEDREEFKEDYLNRNYDVLCNMFKSDPVSNKPNKNLEKYLDEVANKCFTKAIIVSINLPDGGYDGRI